MKFLRLEPVALDLGDVLVQVIAVALGVILGFAATAWNEHLHQQSLLRQTVANIVDELRSNQSGMRVVMGRHASTAATLAKLAERGRSSTRISLSDARVVLRRANAETNVPLGIAWQIAQNDQGLTLFPYHERYDLAFIYQLQTFYYQREQRYDEMILSISEPPNDNFYFEVVDLANQLQSVVGVERQLDVLYTKALQRAASEYGS